MCFQKILDISCRRDIKGNPDYHSTHLPTLDNAGLHNKRYKKIYRGGKSEGALFVIS